jgi:predicted RNase H-like HicB family nuclease
VKPDVTQDAQRYVRLPYDHVWEWREDDAEPYWVVRLAEIPEVAGGGESRTEAEATLGQCLEDYVAYRLAEGLPIPEPEPEAAGG